ncbi:rodlin [Streptomyces longisporoflavus]|uniref:Rodlin n=1 Tax=Streptomyces longisporoflavus TaxID=28044 RepID=A0ABW7QQ57_9ACTN
MRIPAFPLALSLAALALAGTAGNAAAAADDDSTTSASGNNAEQSYGNSSTDGRQSPQLSAVQGSLNKVCAGIPVKANVGALVGILVPVAVQDIPILSAPQNQQCTENSTQAKGDEPLSHLVNDIPVLSGNGTANG